MKQKTTSKSKLIEVEVVKAAATAVVKVQPLKEFEAARMLVAEIRELGHRTQHKSLLLGFELNKLKSQFGERRGGDRKSKDQSTQAANFDRWDKIVVQQTGLSYDTCQRWMIIAKGAAKSLPILMAPDVLKKPFRELPEARQAEVMKVLHKAADGQTMGQMMLSLGGWKEKPHKAPPRPTKQSAENRNENANNQTLTAEQFMEQAKDEINTLHDMHIGGSWNYLDTEDLADLENKLTAYLRDVSAKIKAGKGTK